MMGRVSQETLDKLQVFLNSLPDEVKGKCSLCSETLTDVVKKAEVNTGAGTATVTRAIAEEINKNAAQADKVAGHALNERVRQKEGLNDRKIRNPESNQGSGIVDIFSEKNKLLTAVDVLKNIVVHRENLVRFIRELKKLSESGSLTSDETHTKIENELSLIVTEAKIAGLQLRGLE